MYNEADLATRRASWHGKLSLALGLMGAAAQRAAAPAAPAPEHLHWSSTYDTFFPAAESHRWLNMGLSVYRQSWPGGCGGAAGPDSCGLQAKLAAWEQFGIPSFYDLCDHPCSQRDCPDITNASAPWGEARACPIWQRGHVSPKMPFASRSVRRALF